MRSLARPMPPWLSATLLATEGLALLALELRRPLRTAREPKARRDARNAVIAALALGATVAVEAPIAARLARFAGARRWGIAGRLPLPAPARAIAAVALMDYTMYLWHVLAHRTPLLWRFHVVHHVDRGLDVSTALRFHAGEQILSVPWRAMQILVIGTTPLQLTLWQTAFLASIVFHHSNVRLPARFERVLRLLIITPPLHGIHHADRRELEYSNLSSGLTLWDVLHRTYRSGIAQERLTIGLPAYARDADVALRRVLTLPFESQRDAFAD